MKDLKPCIEVKNLNFKYGENQVLQNISFAVQNGEYLGIIGPNGGGKTTLLKIILGLLKPTSGKIFILGKDSNQCKEKASIGYVPQRSTQGDFSFPATVEEVVKSGRTPRIGTFKKFQISDYAAVAKAMEITGVTKNKNRLIGSLSGGERQKVFIARALAGDPKILVLDEPTVAVDIGAQEKFYNFLSDLNKKLKLTILFVSHDIDVVAKEVDSVLCLNKTVVCHGSPRDFIKEEYLEKLYGRKVKSMLHEH